MIAWRFTKRDISTNTAVTPNILYMKYSASRAHITVSAKIERNVWVRQCHFDIAKLGMSLKYDVGMIGDTFQTFERYMALLRFSLGEKIANTVNQRNSLFYGLHLGEHLSLITSASHLIITKCTENEVYFANFRYSPSIRMFCVYDASLCLMSFG